MVGKIANYLKTIFAGGAKSCIFKTVKVVVYDVFHYFRKNGRLPEILLFLLRVKPETLTKRQNESLVCWKKMRTGRG